MNDDDRIQQALQDLTLDRPYYNARVAGSRIEFPLYGGEIAIWTGPGADPGGDPGIDPGGDPGPDPGRIPTGNLDRFLVTKLRHMAQEQGIATSAGGRPVTKRQLIAELSAARAKESPQ